MYKNQAGQNIHIFAYDEDTGAATTGDASNITAYMSLDGFITGINDTNPDELSAAHMPGLYSFGLAQAETNCDSFAFYAQSDTSGVKIDPIIGFTTKPNDDILMLETYINTVNSQTSFIVDEGAAQSGTYQRSSIVFYDTSDNNYPSMRYVLDYISTTKTFTINAAPDFTIASGDMVRIFAIPNSRVNVIQ